MIRKHLIRQQTQENLSKVWNYLWYKTNKERKIISKKGILLDKRLDTRPVEIRTLFVAQHCGLTYGQVRKCLDILALNGYINKYVVKHPTQYKKMWIQRLYPHKYLFTTILN